MPSRESIVSFEEPPAPEGADPYVNGAGPSPGIAVVPPRAEWPGLFETLAVRVRAALGWRALAVEHVGSTSVPGLSAKPTIDIDLIVADPDREEDYVPALEQQGFVLRVREPWWFGHRMLALQEPACHLHVFGPDSPEPVKHRIFRDCCAGIPTIANATRPRSCAPQPRRPPRGNTPWSTTPARSPSSGRSTTAPSAPRGSSAEPFRPLVPLR